MTSEKEQNIRINLKNTAGVAKRTSCFVKRRGEPHPIRETSVGRGDRKNEHFPIKEVETVRNLID